MNFFKKIFNSFKTANKKVLEDFIYKKFRIRPKNIKLYEKAFTHKSISADFNNERLEFLGDSILSSVIVSFLYHKYEGKNEGALSKITSKLVSRDHLNTLGDKLELHKHIKYVTHENGHKNIKGNTLEALIGAIYLDYDFKTIEKVIKTQILNKYVSLNRLEKKYKDYKSLLLIWSQRNKKKVVFDTKKLHKKDVFEITLLVDGKIITKAQAQSKKRAEQEVSKKALQSKTIG